MSFYPLESAGDSSAPSQQPTYNPPPSQAPPPLPSKPPVPSQPPVPNYPPSQPPLPSNPPPQQTQPLQSSDSAPYYNPSAPPQQQLPPPTEQQKSTLETFKACFSSWAWHVFVVICVFVVAGLLIGIGGVLEIIFIFAGKSKAFPELLFSVYSMFVSYSLVFSFTFYY